MLLRGEIVGIIFGTGFLLAGLAAWAIAITRRGIGLRIFFWLGAWSGIYGARALVQTPSVLATLPRWAQAGFPAANVITSYIVVVIASLSYIELTRGAMRRFMKAVVVAGLLIAALGTGWFFATGDTKRLMLYNNLLAACILCTLLAVVLVPQLSRRFLVLPHRGVLAVGTIVFATQAISSNVLNVLGRPLSSVPGHLGFVALLSAFGYSALQMVSANERRLLSIENELEVARQIQSSILPTAVPGLANVRISAMYRPMTAVAGDFYEFIPVDRDHAGFLVADVCGHGVPAALIASMLKVAVQSLAVHADDPGQALYNLNRILCTQLRGQLVSAAYLWIDMQSRTARYSAAGHPPLLRWHDGRLEPVESNGLLFGVFPDAQYPTRELSLVPGNRLLLYTDGVVEPENASGEPFGHRRLQQVLASGSSLTSAELSDRILNEVRAWQPDHQGQQDDITLLVLDIG